MTDEGEIRGGIRRPETIARADWHRAELLADGLLVFPVESQRHEVQAAYRALMEQRHSIRTARLQLQRV
jgi:hypothetical protein